jgi:hypothetical protein
MTIYTQSALVNEAKTAAKFVRNWYGWKVSRVDSWEVRIDGQNTCLAVTVCGIKDGEPVSHTTTVAI